MIALPEEFVPHPEQAEEIDMKIVDGIFVKSTRVPRANSYLRQHAHVYDHVSLIAYGAARLWKDGVLVGDFKAPQQIKIAAHSKHQFMTLEDNTVIACIHNVSRALGSAEGVDAVEVYSEI